MYRHVQPWRVSKSPYPRKVVLSSLCDGLIEKDLTVGSLWTLVPPCAVRLAGKRLLGWSALTVGISNTLLLTSVRVSSFDRNGLGVKHEGESEKKASLAWVFDASSIRRHSKSANLALVHRPRLLISPKYRLAPPDFVPPVLPNVPRAQLGRAHWY